MRWSIFTLILILCASLSSLCRGQVSYSLSKPKEAQYQSDTTQSASSSNDFETEEFEEEDFSPGLFFIVLIVSAFMFICIGVGIVLTALGLLIIFALVSLGILSTSIIVGLYNKSFSKGFKTFLVLSTSVGGLFIGASGFWFLNELLDWWTKQTALLTGTFSGLLAGLLFGLLVFYVLQRMAVFFKGKLKVI